MYVSHKLVESLQKCCYGLIYFFLIAWWCKMEATECSLPLATLYIIMCPNGKTYFICKKKICCQDKVISGDNWLSHFTGFYCPHILYSNKVFYFIFEAAFTITAAWFYFSISCWDSHHSILITTLVYSSLHWVQRQLSMYWNRMILSFLTKPR